MTEDCYIFVATAFPSRQTPIKFNYLICHLHRSNDFDKNKPMKSVVPRFRILSVGRRFLCVPVLHASVF